MTFRVHHDIMKHRFHTPEEIYRKRAGLPGFCSLDEISDRLIQFTVLLEDPMFAVHRGYNPKRLKMAVLNYFRRDAPLFGGSTITQQLVKNLYFTFDKKVSRKILELFLAIRFEKRLTKAEILELYLNVIYYGNGRYGIHDAARFYFGKSPKELTANQSFFLAAILAFTWLNPLFHPQEFTEWRNIRAHKLPVIADEATIGEILRHGADCLDEELRPTAEDGREGPAPMLNEKYGIYGTDPLVLFP